MKAAEKCYRIENKKRGVLLTRNKRTRNTTKQTRGQFQGGINLLFPKDSQDIRIKSVVLKTVKCRKNAVKTMEITPNRVKLPKIT